jgi:hypothetical protein
VGGRDETRVLDRVSIPELLPIQPMIAQGLRTFDSVAFGFKFNKELHLVTATCKISCSKLARLQERAFSIPQ